MNLVTGERGLRVIHKRIRIKFDKKTDSEKSEMENQRKENKLKMNEDDLLTSEYALESI